MAKRKMTREERNRKFQKDLHQQAYDAFSSKIAFGHSKHQAKLDGSITDQIFSISTYQDYWRHIKYFIKYVQEHHPDCTRLKDARQYVPEWLQYRIDQGLSPWTIHTEAKAVGKLFGITPCDPDYFTCPIRKREYIKRSRVDVERDKHFSVTNNDELIKFCKGTGLRRGELSRLKGGDLFTRDQLQKELDILLSDLEPTEDTCRRIAMLKDTLEFSEEYFTYIRRGKGGRPRFCPIVGNHANQIIERIQSTPKDQRVWLYIHCNADIHAYRADYAVTVYRKYAREIADIPYDKINAGSGHRYQSEVYHCQGDEVGKKLDKRAMLYASRALGHNRISVIASSYLRGL